jgi:endonuclease YncB( thermonuclease family)
MTPKKTIKILFFFIALIFSAQLNAKEITGKVIKVVDGDTVYILTKEFKTVKTRLSFIDAPERSQAFGNKAKRYLTDLIANKNVKFISKKKDKYGREIGKIIYNGKDINLEMIYAGYAWHYKYYQKDQTPNERLRYTTAENFAKSYGTGLWKEKNAIPPWKWRKLKRKKSKKQIQ